MFLEHYHLIVLIVITTKPCLWNSLQIYSSRGRTNFNFNKCPNTIRKRNFIFFTNQSLNIQLTFLPRKCKLNDQITVREWDSYCMKCASIHRASCLFCSGDLKNVVGDLGTVTIFGIGLLCRMFRASPRSFAVLVVLDLAWFEICDKKVCNGQCPTTRLSRSDYDKVLQSVTLNYVKNTAIRLSFFWS